MIDPMRAQTTERWQHAFRKAIKSNGAAQVRRLDFGIYEVPSASEQGTTYVVCGVAQDGSDFTCTCKAAECGNPCWHRAATILRRTQENALREWRQMQRKEARRAPKEPALPRFWRKVDTTSSPTGCWLWTGSTKRHGYGTFFPDHDHGWNVHRWAYVQFVGPIPDGYEIDHLCRVRNCVNPNHLEAVTPLVNGQRAHVPPTHCPHGHPYDLINTIWQKNGDRKCRACNRERCAARYARMRRATPKRIARGERHASAKVGEAQVRAMRAAWDTGEASLPVLMARYGLSKSATHAIVRRKTWRHLP